MRSTQKQIFEQNQTLSVFFVYYNYSLYTISMCDRTLLISYFVFISWREVRHADGFG